MRIWSINTCGVLACLLSLPCAAQQVAPAPEATTPAVAEPSKPGERSLVTVPASFDEGQGTGGMLAAPLSDEKLSSMRGGDDSRLSEMQLNGTVANNSTVNVASGNNTISSGSFSNMSGLPMVIQNSGSNVLIQNATIVNVQFQP
jgi:hypothetical protein